MSAAAAAMAAGLGKAPKLGPGALAKFVVTNKTAVASVARVATRVAAAHSEEAHAATFVPFTWSASTFALAKAPASGIARSAFKLPTGRRQPAVDVSGNFVF